MFDFSEKKLVFFDKLSGARESGEALSENETDTSRIGDFRNLLASPKNFNNITDFVVSITDTDRNVLNRAGFEAFFDEIFRENIAEKINGVDEYLAQIVGTSIALSFAESIPDRIKEFLITGEKKVLTFSIVTYPEVKIKCALFYPNGAKQPTDSFEFPFFDSTYHGFSLPQTPEKPVPEEFSIFLTNKDQLEIFAKILKRDFEKSDFDKRGFHKDLKETTGITRKDIRNFQKYIKTQYSNEDIDITGWIDAKTLTMLEEHIFGRNVEPMMERREFTRRYQQEHETSVVTARPAETSPTEPEVAPLPATQIASTSPVAVRPVDTRASVEVAGSRAPVAIPSEFVPFAEDKKKLKNLLSRYKENPPKNLKDYKAVNRVFKKELGVNKGDIVRFQKYVRKSFDTNAMVDGLIGPQTLGFLEKYVSDVLDGDSLKQQTQAPEVSQNGESDVEPLSEDAPTNDPSVTESIEGKGRVADADNFYFGHEVRLSNGAVIYTGGWPGLKGFNKENKTPIVDRGLREAQLKNLYNRFGGLDVYISFDNRDVIGASIEKLNRELVAAGKPPIEFMRRSLVYGSNVLHPKNRELIDEITKLVLQGKKIAWNCKFGNHRSRFVAAAVLLNCGAAKNLKDAMQMTGLKKESYKSASQKSLLAQLEDFAEERKG